MGRGIWGGVWEWLYLCVVAADTGASAPGTDADVSLAVGEGADEFLEFGMVFDGVDAGNIAFGAGVDAVLEAVLLPLARFVPGSVQLLHEERIPLARGWVARLLNSHVAAGADNVAQIDKVVAYFPD